jgi:hypothetical protein
MPDVRRRSFVSRHLDPASHMGEILFGLIMTLTFTLAAGIVIQEEGREDVLGGLAAGWLVFACSFPAVLPFLLLDEPHVALRVSNAIPLGG